MNLIGDEQDAVAGARGRDGAQFVADRRIESLKEPLADDYDAVFVGCGAPRETPASPRLGLGRSL